MREFKSKFPSNEISIKTLWYFYVHYNISTIYGNFILAMLSEKDIVLTKLYCTTRFAPLREVCLWSYQLFFLYIKKIIVYKFVCNTTPHMFISLFCHKKYKCAKQQKKKL